MSTIFLVHLFWRDNKGLCIGHNVAKFSESPPVVAVKYCSPHLLHPQMLCSLPDAKSFPFPVAPAPLTGPQFPPSCHTWVTPCIRLPCPQRRNSTELSALKGHLQVEFSDDFYWIKASLYHTSRVCFSCITSVSPGMGTPHWCGLSSHTDGSSEVSVHIDKHAADLCLKPLLPGSGLVRVPDRLGLVTFCITIGWPLATRAW